MRGLVVAMVLLAPACGVGAVEATTADSAVEVPTMTTTAVVEPTIHTLEPGRSTDVEIPGRGLILEPNVTYVASDFVVPASFTPAEPGWRSLGARSEWVNLTWLDTESSPDSITLLIVLRRESVGEALQAVLDTEGVEAVSEVADAVVAGVPGRSIDLEGLPSRLQQQPDCATGSGFFFGVHELGVLERGEQTYGIPWCSRSRLWVFEVDGSTLAVLASTLQSDRFDEFVPGVEHLLESISFEAV